MNKKIEFKEYLKHFSQLSRLSQNKYNKELLNKMIDNSLQKESIFDSEISKSQKYPLISRKSRMSSYTAGKDIRIHKKSNRYASSKSVKNIERKREITNKKDSKLKDFESYVLSSPKNNRTAVKDIRHKTIEARAQCQKKVPKRCLRKSFKRQATLILKSIDAELRSSICVAKELKTAKKRRERNEESSKKILDYYSSK
ncbi:unnamed protein product [Moneuplotes crassus]|uniref:Uncharacterized protein n=1 Tax=Euplotes crassus TaxID=5936 RepID=A0AAD1UF05_EUPCR|nr:unnamed protein product [Moneuplotes crassus]